MPSPDKRPPLLVLVGPTAVGKTDISLRLAADLQAEILSADSRLFYRGMDIGTAKPSREEQQAVPHHLIDFLHPDESYSLAAFQAEVYRITADVKARGRLPFMVGGTGQYVRAITEGWSIPAGPPDYSMRAVLEQIAEQHGPDDLHGWLQMLDPAAAASIDPRNLRRTVRALEVVFKTGRPFSTQRRTGDPRFNSIVIGLIRPRKELYARIDLRIERMFADGLIEEVRSLLAAGYSAELPAMSAIGYREVSSHLRGEITLEEAVASMKKRSRALVRRQANWFKAEDPGITWFDAGEGALARVEGFVRECL